MYSEILCFVLVTTTFGIADNAFAFRQIYSPSGDKATNIAWEAKDGSENKDYKANPGYQFTSSTKDHGGTVISKYDKVTDGNKGAKQRDSYTVLEYPNKGNEHSNNYKVGGNGNDYNHEYKHGYSRAHGYHRRHHHRRGNGDHGANDDYSNYYGAHFEHDNNYKDRNNGKAQNIEKCDYGKCQDRKDHYSVKFEYHYDDSGAKNNDKGNAERDSSDKYSYYYGDINEHDLDRHYNDSVDDQGNDYHSEYAGNGQNHGHGNYGKDYSDYATNYHH